MRWHSTVATRLTLIALASLPLASCFETDNDLKDWLASNPTTPPVSCPTSPTEPVAGPPGTVLPQMPYFKPGKEALGAAGAGRPVTCLQDGPYFWHGTRWYVQRINFVNAAGEKHSAVRVCSLDAVEGKDGPALDLIVKTPDGDLQFVGPNKCQLVVSS
jgi:hypothetical protein